MKNKIKVTIYTMAVACLSVWGVTPQEEILIEATKEFALSKNIEDFMALGWQCVHLAQTGIRPDVVGARGEAALHWLARVSYFVSEDRKTLLKALWEAFKKVPKFNVDIENNCGQTPSYLAAIEGSGIFDFYDF